VLRLGRCHELVLHQIDLHATLLLHNAPFKRLVISVLYQAAGLADLVLVGLIIVAARTDAAGVTEESTGEADAVELEALGLGTLANERTPWLLVLELYLGHLLLEGLGLHEGFLAQAAGAAVL